MYRILTENKRLSEIGAALRNLKLDYTMLFADGCYQGETESSLAIELITNDLQKVKVAAELIGVINNQQTVFLQFIPDRLIVYDVQEDKWKQSEEFASINGTGSSMSLPNPEKMVQIS